MNNRQHFDFLKQNVPNFERSAEQHVEVLVNDLLQTMYRPVKQDSDNKSIFVPDFDRIGSLGINTSEPVNWSALSGYVNQKGDIFIIILDEAMAGKCPTLCQFVYDYLTSWGWNVEVQTEW